VKAGSELSVTHLCGLTGFSRSGYYRAQNAGAKPSAEDLKLRDAMHRVALEWPAYGSRRMRKELERQGWKVNRKRLQRLMREDNLLCVAKRKFVVTTESGHPLPVYPNLPPEMTVTGINQLWIADIT
jgi:transposase InsO family protein